MPQTATLMTHWSKTDSVHKAKPELNRSRDF